MPVSSHSRHSSAVSTSSAIRSTSPSPSASPVSPSLDGLSRRLSWNRGRQDNLTVNDVHPGYGLAGLSRTHLMHPHDEYDLGAGTIPVPRPFLHQFSSDASLDSTGGLSSGQSEGNDREDRERLTASASGSTVLGHRRQPSRRVYDEDGLAPSSAPAKLAASVGRSPTFQSVSRTIRKASIRVVNIMGSDHEHGMARLEDEEDEDIDKKVDDEGESQTPLPILSTIPKRPDPKPAEARVTGRTLGLFGSHSQTRRAMDRLLRYQ